MTTGPLIGDSLTIRAMLERAIQQNPDRAYLKFESREMTFGELDQQSNRLANGLADLGMVSGDRIAVMLPNHPDYVVTFFALIKLGAIQVPVNTRLRGESLAYQLRHCEPALMIADASFAHELPDGTPRMVWRNSAAETVAKKVKGHDFGDLMNSDITTVPPTNNGPDDLLSIMYTSGTTGPPKGVMVTDKMLRAAGYAGTIGAGVRVGDVQFVWDPLYHISGVQAMIMALGDDVSMALVERFSASRFWDQVRAFGATHIHFLGGILQILLKQPPRADDRDNPVRVAWGGGAPREVWKPFEQRFDLQVRENYGMTEASSLTTINAAARFGSIGKPAPWFDVRIADEQGDAVVHGVRGEILVHGKEPGLITPGYFRNPEATAAALRDGWLHTGDAGHVDEEGFVYYKGRLKDCVRKRGENISAWEIERTVEQLPWVEESAVIGVPDELGDEDVKLFVKTVPDAPPEPLKLFEWCDDKLARFQVPSFIAFIDGFEKTGTERIRKETLSRSTDDSYSRDEGGRLVAPIGSTV